MLEGYVFSRGARGGASFFLIAGRVAWDPSFGGFLRQKTKGQWLAVSERTTKS